MTDLRHFVYICVDGCPTFLLRELLETNRLTYNINPFY